MHSILKLAALPHGVLFRERRRGLVILIYHRVGGGTASDIDLPAAVFERQMAHLRARYTPVSLDALADGTLPAEPDRDLVAVTFDDGYRDLYDHAMPALLTHRIPATVYLATRHVDEQRAFDFGAFATAASRPMPLAWAQLREMVGSGLITVGGHTHNHVNLTRVSPDVAGAEVRQSREVIEERLGYRPRHFAYPWGEMNETVRRLTGEWFETAARGGSAKNLLPAADRLGLWRRPIQQNDGMWLFTLKVASYLDGEEAFRTLASRLRGRRS